jgi:hypothetical protein
MIKAADLTSVYSTQASSGKRIVSQAYIHPASLADIANKTLTPRPDPKCALRVYLPKRQQRFPDFTAPQQI